MLYNKLWLCVSINKICSAKILVKLKPIAAIFNLHAIMYQVQFTNTIVKLNVLKFMWEFFIIKLTEKINIWYYFCC